MKHNKQDESWKEVIRQDRREEGRQHEHDPIPYHRRGVCPACHGSGEGPVGEEICHNCHGKGEV